MELGWRLIAIAGVASAAILLPVTAAQAPRPDGDGDPTAAAPTVTDFPADIQMAPRTLQDPAVAELSGMAASRRHPGILYAVNDSGNAAEVYAIDAAGATVATLTVRGAENYDWEALAPGVDDDGNPVLWIGDIGDNGALRPYVRLLRIPEPQVLDDQETDARIFRAAYPDGPHNAEALAVHPLSNEMWIITKRTEAPAGVYRLPTRLRTDATNPMQRILDAPASITDGAWEVSPAGEPRLVLSDYWRLHRLAGQTWISALGPLQLQREALAWPYLPDGPASNEVLLGSEGSGSRIITGKVP